MWLVEGWVIAMVSYKEASVVAPDTATDDEKVLLWSTKDWTALMNKRKALLWEYTSLQVTNYTHLLS